MSCFLGKIHLRGRPEETKRPIKSMVKPKVRLTNLSNFNPSITVQLWRPKCSYAPRICICLYISDAEHQEVIQGTEVDQSTTISH